MSFVLQVFPGEEFLIEAEVAQITDAHGIKYAGEMIALVLHDARVKVRYGSVYRRAALVVALIAQALITGHEAAQARNAEAAFPALLDFLIDRPKQRIDEYSARHGLGFRITRIEIDAENGYLQKNPNLRRSQPRPVERIHRILHVGDEGTQLRRVEALDRLGRLEQPRIAHSQYRSNRHGVKRLARESCARVPL